MQGDDAVPPMSFGRFSSDPPALAHLALLARCIMDANCADNLDDEGNQLVLPDVSKWQETLTHLQEANGLIRHGTGSIAFVNSAQLKIPVLARCCRRASQTPSHTRLAAHRHCSCPSGLPFAVPPACCAQRKVGAPALGT